MGLLRLVKMFYRLGMLAGIVRCRRSDRRVDVVYRGCVNVEIWLVAVAVKVSVVVVEFAAEARSTSSAVAAVADHVVLPAIPADQTDLCPSCSGAPRYG